MVAIGSLLPPVIAFFAFSSEWTDYDDAGAWLLGNPFAIVIDDNYRLVGIAFASICAVFTVILSMRWFSLTLLNMGSSFDMSSLKSSFVNRIFSCRILKYTATKAQF